MKIGSDSYTRRQTRFDVIAGCDDSAAWPSSAQQNGFRDMSEPQHGHPAYP